MPVFRRLQTGSIAPIAPDLACTLRTIRAFRDEDFDVIHIHEPICPGPSQTALFLRSAPIVGTWHAAGGSKAYLTPGVRWLATRMNIRAAVSQDARDMAHEALGGDYEVVFNGIEVDNFINSAAAKCDGPTIAYVGRHEPRKGLDVPASGHDFVASECHALGYVRWPSNRGAGAKNMKLTNESTGLDR